MKTVPLKRLVDPDRPVTYGIVQAGPDIPGGVPYIRPVDMDGHEGVRDPAALRTTSPEIAQTYKRSSIDLGDVVVSIGPSFGKTMKVTDPALAGANLTQGTARVAPAVDVDGDYLRWSLQSSLALSHWESVVGGATFRALNLEPLANTPVVPWDLKRQRRISAFLHRATTAIDELLASKRRQLIASIQLRQSIAYEAVAGSLTGHNVDLRGSTIPWLHRVPGHWQEASLRLVAELGSGHTPSRSHPEWWIECTVPWVTTGEVARLRSDRHEYIYETRERISELGLANSSAVVHPAGTVVLCRTSASAGYSGIMAEDMATSQDFATWTCGPLLRPRFLLLCLRAMRRDLLERLGQGSTHVTIYMPDIESIRVPLPPVEEQDRIVVEAWRRMDALAEAEDVLDKQVRLLEERRRSLITSTISGEMEVP